MIINMKKNCFDYAINYVSRFPKTEFELKLQLLKKWYSEIEIDQTIASLKRNDFVNDKLFAQSYIYSELIKKGKSKYIVIQKLRKKWLDNQLIQEQIHKHQKDIDKWIENRIKIHIDKLKNKWLDWFEIIQKLKLKWYSFNDIKKAL